MATPLRLHGPIVVAGYGAVGRKVVEMLHDAGETTIVIDRSRADQRSQFARGSRPHRFIQTR